ncbi:hypothetical protein FWH30_02480, partial [Microgenomates group bacterium]|nr:hypothetical protein [Microgenomates group bacterium]
LKKFRCFENNEWKDCIQDIINRPELWDVGREYDFGSDTFGQRFTDDITAAANVSANVMLDTNADVAELIQAGGTVGLGDSPIRAYLPFNDSSGYGRFYLDNSDNRVYLETMTPSNRDGVTNSDYNVWIKYLKNI